LAKIPGLPEEIFEAYIQDVRNVFGDDLSSIILYGSGAKNEYVPKRSDINFLIILTQNGMDRLDRALPLVEKWRKSNVAVPLFLTRKYIESGLDTFPVEFLDLKHFHKVIYGDDLLADITINRDDLRHQIERELRGKLLHLREGFLATGNDRELLHDMLASSVSTFVSIFKALLYLKGEKTEGSRTVIFQKTSQVYELQDGSFQHVLNMKNGQWRGSKIQLHDITKSYIAQIKRLVEIVDKM
jgi:predicted nucleotidyltransferase